MLRLIIKLYSSLIGRTQLTSKVYGSGLLTKKNFPFQSWTAEGMSLKASVGIYFGG